MKELELMTPSKVAETYGGDKQKIANAVRMGVVDPTVGVMAGMFIDRMRSAAVKEMAPQSTVAQDVLTPPVPQMPMGMPMAGLEAAAAAPMDRGLAALPVDESMIPNPEGYADGGIVAFASGNPVEFEMPMDSRRLDPEVMRAYYLSRNMPVPAELMTPAERAEAARPPYPAGVFPKIGRFFGDVGESVRNFVAPGGVGFYSEQTPDIQTVAPAARQTPAITGADLRKSDQAEMALRSAPPSAPTVVPKVSETAKGRARVGTEGAPAVKGVEGYLNEYQKALRAAGVPENVHAEDFAANQAMRERLAKDRDQAASMAMIEAGLGIMGGKSQYALQNIGEGAKSAVSSYARALKDIKEDEKEYNKIDRDLRRADAALKRGDVDKAFELRSQAETRAIQMRQANKPSQFAEVTAALRSPDPAVRRSAEAYLGASKTGALTIEDALKVVREMPKNINASPQQLMQQAQELIGAQGSASRFQGFSARPLTGQ